MELSQNWRLSATFVQHCEELEQLLSIFSFPSTRLVKTYPTSVAYVKLAL